MDRILNIPKSNDVELLARFVSSPMGLSPSEAELSKLDKLPKITGSRVGLSWAAKTLLLHSKLIGFFKAVFVPHQFRRSVTGSKAEP